MTPFDWHRIFLGDLSFLFLGEIVIRTAVMYLYGLILLRLTGSRGIGQLSAMDVAIIIALGSAVGDPMFYPNVPLLHGLTVITVIVFIQRGISLLITNRSRVENLIEGKPLLIIERGHLELDNLAQATLSHEDVFMPLRQSEIKHLGQVDLAYLEHDGRFSIYKFKPGECHPGLPIVPPYDIEKPVTLKAGYEPSIASIFACPVCGETTSAGKGTFLPDCPRCGNESWVEAAQ